MQAINIAAYKRLGDSYAEENGALLGPQDVPGKAKRVKQKHANGNSCVKNGYEKLEGNSDSEDGYQTAAETEDEDTHKNYLDSEETGYQRSAEHDGRGSHLPSSKTHQNDSGGGYQSLADIQCPKYQGYQTHLEDYGPVYEKTWPTGTYQLEVADDGGYFKLEGFSEFCGNINNLKSTEIKNGYYPIASDLEVNTKKLYEEPPEMPVEDVKIESSSELCSFKVLVKICQMTFCVLATTCSFFARSWLATYVGAWFLLANVTCAGVSCTVLMVIVYHKMGRIACCSRKVVQWIYLVMLPMLLSAGLLGASVATSTQYTLEFEKTMIMVASMFTLMGLFAVIGDIVMNRRTWRMFQMVGGNAYIHAAFMA